MVVFLPECEYVYLYQLYFVLLIVRSRLWLNLWVCSAHWLVVRCICGVVFDPHSAVIPECRLSFPCLSVFCVAGSFSVSIHCADAIDGITAT